MMMNRTLSVTAVLALMLLAVAICVKQTFDVRESISGVTWAMLISIESVFAGILIASVITMLRKRSARQKNPVSRRPVPVAV